MARSVVEKQSALFSSGVYAEIMPYAAAGNDIPDALFVDKKPVMWPGNAITLRDVRLKDGHVLITASEISYPFIGALRDAAFRSNLDATGLVNIRPPLAICTFAITTDHLLILTVRASQPMYIPAGCMVKVEIRPRCLYNHCASIG